MQQSSKKYREVKKRAAKLRKVKGKPMLIVTLAVTLATWPSPNRLQHHLIKVSKRKFISVYLVTRDSQPHTTID
jgi:hypothetical protein